MATDICAKLSSSRTLSAGPLSLLQPLVAICSCLPQVRIRILRPGLGRETSASW